MRLAGIQKHCPLRIDDEFQFRVRNCRENRFAIHGQKDCGAVIHENKRRIILYIHRLGGLRLGYIGEDTIERDADDFRNKGLDVRSLRYPGLIGYKTKPGGGTTDYAVDIFFKALTDKKYECFLKPDTYLPMMYMDDAVKATLDLMNAPVERIRIRSSYNVTAMSFCPSEIANEIKKYIPEFEISYNPDFRQAIADSWPRSINDSAARIDWGWEPQFDLEEMSNEILKNLPKAL